MRDDDPYDPFVLIDRKLNVTTLSGQLDQLRRQAEALRQNPGHSVRIEVPTNAAATAADRALREAGVRGAPISVQLVPFP
jgi:hypothetical protein